MSRLRRPGSNGRSGKIRLGRRCLDGRDGHDRLGRGRWRGPPLATAGRRARSISARGLSIIIAALTASFRGYTTEASGWTIILIPRRRAALPGPNPSLPLRSLLPRPLCSRRMALRFLAMPAITFMHSPTTDGAEANCESCTSADETNPLWRIQLLAHGTFRRTRH